MESPYPYENEDPEDEKSEVEEKTLGLLNSDTWFGIANSTGQNPKKYLVQTKISLSIYLFLVVILNDTLFISNESNDKQLIFFSLLKVVK